MFFGQALNLSIYLEFKNAWQPQNNPPNNKNDLDPGRDPGFHPGLAVGILIRNSTIKLIQNNSGSLKRRTQQQQQQHDKIHQTYSKHLFFAKCSPHFQHLKDVFFASKEVTCHNKQIQIDVRLLSRVGA